MSQEEENKKEKKSENIIDSDISKKSLSEFRVGDTIKVNYKNKFSK